jgi:hypothetical protein
VFVIDCCFRARVGCQQVIVDGRIMTVADGQLRLVGVFGSGAGVRIAMVRLRMHHLTVRSNCGHHREVAAVGAAYWDKPMNTRSNTP